MQVCDIDRLVVRSSGLIGTSCPLRLRRVHYRIKSIWFSVLPAMSYLRLDDIPTLELSCSLHVRSRLWAQHF